MYHMKVSDPDIWELVGTGNFSLKKTEHVFCMLGIDQTLDQFNGTLEVIGCLRDITQKSNAIAKYFLAPELACLEEEVDLIAGISKPKSSHHHE